MEFWQERREFLLVASTVPRKGSFSLGLLFVILKDQIPFILHRTRSGTVNHMVTKNHCTLDLSGHEKFH
jgi:hypothetical protein